jgi:hypothetical protein
MIRILALLTILIAIPAFAVPGGVGSTRFGVNGPFSLIDGSAFIGPNGEVVHRITQDFSIGGETGLQFHPGDVSGWIIPLAAKGLYHFSMRGAPTFHPFVGMSVGLGIVHASYLSRSNTSTEFLWLPQVGATIGADQSFYANLKLGVIGGDFYLGPAIGWWF